MKKLVTLLLAVLMLTVFAGFGLAEDITLDVIIAQYGPNTNNWFLGNGMDGSNFVKKFEEANPGIKLNLEVVSWNDIYTVVSTRISNNNAPRHPQYRHLCRLCERGPAASGQRLLPGRAVCRLLPVLH